MAGKRKGAVRKGHGSMCNICGYNCGNGGGLRSHIKSAHKINYRDYKKCFYGRVKTLITDSWNGSVATKSGKTVITHVLVRRFIGDPGKRGVPSVAKLLK